MSQDWGQMLELIENLPPVPTVHTAGYEKVPVFTLHICLGMIVLVLDQFKQYFHGADQGF